MWKKMTEEERKKIDMLISYGLPVKQIAEITGRSASTISLIKSGKYEEYKVMWRAREAEKKEAATTVVTVDAKDFAKDEQGNYTDILLNAILMKLTQLCDELGVGDKTADKSGLTV